MYKTFASSRNLISKAIGQSRWQFITGLSLNYATSVKSIDRVQAVKGSYVRNGRERGCRFHDLHRSVSSPSFRVKLVYLGKTQR